MGADDGGSNKPHPATTNSRAPCIDEGPRRSRGDGYGNLWYQSPIGDAGTQQVSEPMGYAVAGKILLAAAGAIAGLLLALVTMYLYNSARRRRLSGNGGGGGRRLDRSPAIAAAGDDRNDDDATPRGLDPAVLRALPGVDAGAGAGDCVVCLAELEPGQKARALPRCAHLFHAECIDAWFRDNATCPLCRADVVAPDADAEVALPEVRVDVAVLGVDDAAAAKASMAPAMGRLPSGTDLDKTRRAFFASTRSVSF